MTTVNTNYMNSSHQFGGTPFGNRSQLDFNLTTDASGIATKTDLTTAIGSTDVIRLGVLPKGFRIDDCIATVSVAFAGSTTCSLGIQYVDGVDLASPNAQDAAYLIAGSTSLASTAIIRKTGIKAPITLQKDAYLILTMAGAAQTTTAVLDVSVLGVLTGGN